jgi:hypothetical protein
MSASMISVAQLCLMHAAQNQHLGALTRRYRFTTGTLAVTAAVGFIDQSNVAAAAAESSTATIISKYRLLRRERAVVETGKIGFDFTMAHHRLVFLAISRPRSAARQFYSGIGQVKLT